MRQDMRALVKIAGIMFAATVLGFLVNTRKLSLRQNIRGHAVRSSPRPVHSSANALAAFLCEESLGDIMSRLNNDAGEVQRVSADALLSVLSNVGFLVGAIAMMLWLNWRLFLVGAILVPACVWSFLRYQRLLTTLTKNCAKAAPIWAASSWNRFSACAWWWL